MKSRRSLHWTKIFAIFSLLLLIPISVSASQAMITNDPIDSKVLQQIKNEGKTTFWVIMREQADLSPAYHIKDWNKRGQFVYKQLQKTASQSQASLHSMMLADSIPFKPFWIINAIKVTGDRTVVEKLAARPEVRAIVADGTYEIPTPLPGKEQPRVGAIEWNIDRINAPQVWSTFGVRGEGIVVANIDTGVQFDHPALVAQYRGDMGGGTFDHNYNWFDPSNVCGSPSLVPCDNVGHGTPTMGTMVGDDGGINQIGVAPRARWIAAKGCESNWCSFEALMATGQWVLAPTDLNGMNPRPELRPHIVNNSWGGGPGDTFYQAMVQAWIASGIFPDFSIGNAGPGCFSAGSPGDYIESYASGAFDINNFIAWFSSRGPSFFNNEIKPNIAAPGVDVRSSVPGNWYEIYSGTSMASPHAAGTVALMWSAAPSMVGDISLTRDILDQTAIDMDDLSCGQDPVDPGDNNVWGEGRLDAFAAVEQSPRGPTGTLQGIVTDGTTGLPLSGATIQAVGPSTRTTITNNNGFYSLLLPIGTYDVTASLFGYLSETAPGVIVREGAITTQNFTLTQAPSHTVSGYVWDDEGNPIPNATVTVLNTPIPPATTNTYGFYSFPSVPEGTYSLRAEAGRCNESQTQQIVVTANLTVDFTLPAREDTFGYRCQIIPLDWVDATSELPLYYDDSAVAVNLPFSFPLYGQDYRTAYVSTNGFLNFLELNARFWNSPIPDPSPPNSAIYALWDDLYVDPGAGDRVKVDTLGVVPDRVWILEYENVRFLYDPSRVNFEVKLYERNGVIEFHYLNMPGPGDGRSATVGIENSDGSDAFQYSSDEPALRNGLAIRFLLPPMAIVQGTVTDAVDGLPVARATVSALKDNVPVRQVVTDENGFYRMHLRLGTYAIEASASNYITGSAQVVLDEQNEVVNQDFALRSARMSITPPALEFVLTPGMTHTKVLNLSNVGMSDLTFQIGEVPRLAIGSNPASLGNNSHTQPAEYIQIPVQSVLTGGPTLVFMDFYPWGSDALLQVLNANGIPYDIANSSQMGTIDMSRYKVVFISSDQPQGFYTNYNANLNRFEDYVQAGGFLWFGAAAWGWNGGDFNGGHLPGGATVRGPVFEDRNDVVDNSHPIMQGVPDPFSGTSASHAAFENLPAGTNTIARGQSSGLPTLIEYPFGAGVVLAFGQTLEFGYMYGQDAGLILENSVPYAYAFEPVIDIPWISEDPTSGTVTPGATQQIQVTVNTAGLTPGIYRAKLVFCTNDPRNPRLSVPVTLIVPAYLQRVNAGAGGGAYYRSRRGPLGR